MRDYARRAGDSVATTDGSFGRPHLGRLAGARMSGLSSVCPRPRRGPACDGRSALATEGSNELIMSFLNTKVHENVPTDPFLRATRDGIDLDGTRTAAKLIVKITEAYDVKKLFEGGTLVRTCHGCESCAACDNPKARDYLRLTLDVDGTSYLMDLPPKAAARARPAGRAPGRRGERPQRGASTADGHREVREGYGLGRGGLRGCGRRRGVRGDQGAERVLIGTGAPPAARRRVLGLGGCFRFGEAGWAAAPGRVSGPRPC